MDRTGIPEISENRGPSLNCHVLPCVSLLSVIIHGIPNKDLQSLTTSASGLLNRTEDKLFLAFCLFKQVHCLPEKLPSKPPRSPESEGKAFQSLTGCSVHPSPWEVVPTFFQLLKAQMRLNPFTHYPGWLSQSLANPAYYSWQEPLARGISEGCHIPFHRWILLALQGLMQYMDKGFFSMQPAEFLLSSCVPKLPNTGFR